MYAITRINDCIDEMLEPFANFPSFTDSFFITGKAISWKTALSIFAAICLCGALAGLGTAAFLS